MPCHPVEFHQVEIPQDDQTCISGGFERGRVLLRVDGFRGGGGAEPSLRRHDATPLARRPDGPLRLGLPRRRAAQSRQRRVGLRLRRSISHTGGH